VRIAVFSDVHGNLSALEAVISQIERIPSIDEIVFAGDLCLFGPRPQSCLNVLRSMGITALVGNTDEWIRQPPPLLDTLEEAVLARRRHIRELCAWTASRLDRESIMWLDKLRQQFSWASPDLSGAQERLLIFHANPVDLDRLVFPAPERQIELYGRVRQNDAELQPLFGHLETNTVAFGHLHVPGTRIWRDKTLVNVSSVSLPGDGDARAKFVVFTWEQGSGWSTERHFVEYAVDDEVAAFQKSRPPGWRDSVDRLNTLGFIPQIV
jgi:predicted phosphodiesterase